jgi:PAS domain S-box-containing protein
MESRYRTLLLVEDEAIIALQETMLLQKAGYKVIHSLTGEKAIEIVNTTQGGIDLILMDIDLGKGMDGTEAARQILCTNDIPILFLSAHTEPEIVEKTEEITNYGYVVKPSSFTVLDASIKMAFKLFTASKQLDLDSMEISAANEKLKGSIENFKAVNQKLALSEEKFSKAFQLNPDSITITRLSDGVFLEANRGFTELSGYSYDDVIGRSTFPEDLSIWIRSEDREPFISGLREGGEVTNLEAEFRRKDRTTGFGLLSARIIEIGNEQCIIAITRDINEWKRTQNELRVSEQKFRAAFENSPVGIALTTLDGQLRTVNHVFCNMLGYSMTYVSANDYFSMIHPDDRELSREMERRLIDGERAICHFERRHIHRDGHSIWTEVSIALVMDAEGNPDFFISHIIDISQRKEAEDELRLKSVLLDNAGDAIRALDLEGNIIYANEASCRQAGYSKDELVGKHISIIDTPENKSRSKSIIADIVKNGSARFTTVQTRRDGSVFPVEVSCVLEPNDGKVILSIVRDISERKKVEDRLRLAMDATFEGIWDKDIESGETYYSPAYYKMLGYKAEEFNATESEWYDHIHPEDREFVLAANQDCAENRCEKFDVDFRMKAKDGSWKWINSRGKAVSRDSKGRAIRLIGTHADISDRKRIESELVESRNKYRLLFEGAGDGFLIHDYDQNILAANNKYLERLGYSKEEVLSMKTRQIDQSARDEVTQERMDILAKAGSLSFRSSQRRKDGSLVPVEINELTVVWEGKPAIMSMSRDITNQLKVEDERSRFEQILKSTSDTLKDAYIVSIDRNFNCLYMNKAYHDLKLKSSGVELAIGECLLDDVSLDLLFSANISNFHRALAGEFIKVIEENKSADMILEVVYVPMHNENGEIVGVSAFAIDVTERTQIENALKKSESELRSIISASPDVIAKITKAGKISFCSPKILTLLGYDSMSEILGRKIDKFVDPSQITMAESLIQSILDGKEKRSGQFTLCKKDGTLLFTEINAEVMETVDAENVLLVIRDISDRKKEEKELAENQKKYYDLLNSIGEGFCYIDENEVFRMANPSAERIFKVKQNTLVGRSLFDFLDEEGKEIGKRETSNRKNGKSTDYSTPIIRSDGERRWIHANASPLCKSNEKYAGNSVVFRDITDELKSNEELNRLVKSKEMLMKELEHRVKNSLTLVSSLLKIGTNELSDPTAIGVFEDTVSRIQSMSAIYEQLYLTESVASIDFGIYVDGLAKSILSTFSYDTSRIRLSVEAEHIEIDTKRAISLGLIVNELITNAVKYAFPDNRSGSIKVLFEKIENNVILTVSDDGIGIQDPTIPDSSPTMGISLIRLLTEQIVGFMKFDLSHGTSFSITFKL